VTFTFTFTVKPLNAELNPICHLLALLGAHPIFHISGLRFNYLSFVFDIPENVHVVGRNTQQFIAYMN
jgi:hypothetical protein